LSEVSGSFQGTTATIKLPILHVTFAIERGDGSIFTDDLDFWVDSGFTDSLCLPESWSAKFNAMGIEGIEDNNIGVASGTASGFVYDGQIQKIRLEQNIITMDNPIDCDITCLGPDGDLPLIGLAALKKWKVCLDLPKEILSIS